jgi:hypothetical protein
VNARRSFGALVSADWPVDACGAVAACAGSPGFSVRDSAVEPVLSPRTVAMSAAPFRSASRSTSPDSPPVSARSWLASTRPPSVVLVVTGPRSLWSSRTQTTISSNAANPPRIQPQLGIG